MGNILDIYHRRREKTQQVESLNLEEQDGKIIKEHYKNHNSKNKFMSAFIAYGLTALIAVTVALLYMGMKKTSEKILEYSFRKDTLNEKSLYVNSTEVLKRIGKYTGISLVLALSGATLVFFEPAAAGPGMPEVISYLNGAKFRKYITARAFIIKYISLILIVSSGLVTGYDGPLAHIGLMLAVLYLQAFGRVDYLYKYFSSSNMNARVSGRVLRKSDYLIYGAAGAAAGVAAAFRSPIGGVMFALEEAISHFKPSLVMRSLFGTTVTFFVVGLLYSLVTSGNFGVSAQDLLLFNTEARCMFPSSMVSLFAFVIMGLIMGLMGQIFNIIVTSIVRLKKRYLHKRPILRFVEIIILVFLTEVASVVIPSYADTCVPYNQMYSHMTSYADICVMECTDVESFFDRKPQCKNSFCVPEAAMMRFDQERIRITETLGNVCKVNPLARQRFNVEVLGEFFEPSEDMINSKELQCMYPLKSMFQTSTDDLLELIFSRGVYNAIPARVLAIQGSVYAILAILTYGIMLPTDLVLPTLVIGAVMGRLFGLGFNLISSNIGLLPIDPGSTAIIGAMSFWTGSSQMLMAIAAIAIESTHSLEIMPALLIALLTSLFVSKLIGKSLYHREMHIAHIPYLGFEPNEGFIRKTAKDIMVKDIKYLREEASVEEVKRLLEETEHRGFPVVIGSSRRSSISSVASDSTVNISVDRNGEKPTGVILRSQLKYLLKQSLLNDENDGKENEIKESEDRYIILRDHMFSPPVTISENTIASKAFSIFRKLTMRHLLVVNGSGNLVGILTRKDFIQ